MFRHILISESLYEWPYPDTYSLGHADIPKANTSISLDDSSDPQDQDDSPSDQLETNSRFVENDNQVLAVEAEVAAENFEENDGTPQSSNEELNKYNDTDTVEQAIDQPDNNSFWHAWPEWVKESMRGSAELLLDVNENFNIYPGRSTCRCEFVCTKRLVCGLYYEQTHCINR